MLRMFNSAASDGPTLTPVRKGHVGGDFNHTTRDLGGNGQSLEERSLLGA